MKEILYKSTRSDGAPIPASRAILMGLAEDGGLFVPTQIPALDRSLSDLAKMDYRGVAYEVMKLMLTDFTEEELKGASRTPMAVILIRNRSSRCTGRTGHTFWNCFTGPRSPSRTWLCRSCRT